MSMSEEKISVKTPEFVSLQFQTAGLGSRSVAFIIDQFILIVINIIILIGFLFSARGQEHFGLLFDTIPVMFAVVIVLIFIINGGYFLFLEYFTGGRTIGKKLVGIRVIQDNGHSITLLSSFIRNFLRLVDSLPASYLIGMILIFTHSKHKRLGDIVAGTIVVHEREHKKNKNSALQREIQARHLSKETLHFDEWALKSLGVKEWNLLKAYSERLFQLPMEERYELTKKMANVLLVKVGMDKAKKSNKDLEDMLLVLYLTMKDEWDYEL